MSAPYVPPCRCPDDGPHEPSCPHFDSAYDPAAVAPPRARCALVKLGPRALLPEPPDLDICPVPCGDAFAF